MRRSGRSFYVDHNTKTTTWTRPAAPAYSGPSAATGNTTDSDEAFARYLQAQEEEGGSGGGGGTSSSQGMTDEEYARLLQQEEDAAAGGASDPKEESSKKASRGTGFFGRRSAKEKSEKKEEDESSGDWAGDSSPPPSDFEGALQMRKEVKGLGWRSVYGRIYGSTLAIYGDAKRGGKAELRLELADASIAESESTGKIVSKKDEIFRFKVVPSAEGGESSAAEAVNGVRTVTGETEFATEEEQKRSEWLGRFVVAKAKLPARTELAAKIFKPLIEETSATPERVGALNALADALAADAEAGGALARALASGGTLKATAECLRNGPGQEAAAKCVFYASRGDRSRVAAKVLAEASAPELLLPLLTAPDDSLQRWAAAAMAPAVSFGDAKSPAAKKGARGVVDGGGVFTLVALLSAASRDVQTYALAALVAVCEVGLEDDALAPNVAERAVSAGCCRALAPLCNDGDARVAGAALDVLGSLVSTSAVMMGALRRELAAEPRLGAALVACFTSTSLAPSYHAIALRLLADACYSVDESTGVERRENLEAVAAAARALQARGAVPLAAGAVRSAPLTEDEYPNKSQLGALAERHSAARRGAWCGARHERREDATRLLAALFAHAPGAAEQAVFAGYDGDFDGGLVAALVGCVANDLAASLAERQHSGPLRCSAALPALTLAVAAGSRRRDSRPAVAAAQSGLLELLAKRGFLDARAALSGGLSALLVARAATLVHALVEASWRDSGGRDASIAVTLAAPPGGRCFGVMCALLDACAADLDVPEVQRIAVACANALGSLCGAARPVGYAPHPAEHGCRRDVAASSGALLLLGRCLGSEGQPIAAKRTAARLLGSLLRDDEADARACARAGRPVDEMATAASTTVLEASASALARAGLVGIAAANLASDDALVRADCLDAFAALAPCSGHDDRDTASGAAALGNALARGLVADDAAARYADAPFQQLAAERAKVAVEKAVGALEAVCSRGGARARDAVGLESAAPGALANLARAVSDDDDFSLRVAASSLGALASLATDSEACALVVAKSGALAACRHLIDSSLASHALRLLAVVAPHAPHALLADKALLISLTRAVSATTDDSSEDVDQTKRLRDAALAVLAALADGANPDACDALARAALKVKPAVPALTSAVNGEWGRDFVAQARKLLDAVAVASVTETEVYDDEDGVSVNEQSAVLSSSAGNVSKGAMSSGVDEDTLRRFEEAVYARLVSAESGPKDHLGKIRRSAASVGTADPKALATLIATPREEGGGSAAAVDRACGALAALIANDTTGQTAATAIQAGALGQLLKLAPSSVSASACLFALLDVGEIHRPLLLSSQTPPLASKYVDCLGEMLGAGASPASKSVAGTTSAEGLVEISARAVALLAAVCRDSDAAVLSLRVAVGARGLLFPSVARLAAVAAAEHRAATERPADEIACDGTLVLSCLVAPEPEDAVDDFEDLCVDDLAETSSGVLFEDAEPAGEKLAALVVALADGDEPHREARTAGVSVLLESPTTASALTRAVPALLGLLERLPPGSARARARRAVARLASASREASARLVATGGVDLAVSLVAKHADGDAKRSTAAADAACGLAVLGALVRASKERAARSALAHDELLSALASAVVSVRKSLAYSALKVLVELADAGDSARAYVASRNDLMQALVGHLATLETPAAARLAATVLVNVAAGGAEEREAVAALTDLKPAIFAAFEHTDQLLFSAAAKLVAPVFESDQAKLARAIDKDDDEDGGQLDEKSDDEVDVKALTTALGRVSSEVALLDESGTALVRALSARLSLTLNDDCDESARNTLVKIVAAAVESDAPAVAEVALAELCGPLLNVDDADLFEGLVAALEKATQEDTWLFPASRVTAALTTFLRRALRQRDRDPLVKVAALDTALIRLAAEDSAAALDARRLLALLGANTRKPKTAATAPDAPTTSAAASIAAALGALS